MIFVGLTEVSCHVFFLHGDLSSKSQILKQFGIEVNISTIGNRLHPEFRIYGLVRLGNIQRFKAYQTYQLMTSWEQPKKSGTTLHPGKLTV